MLYSTKVSHTTSCSVQGNDQVLIECVKLDQSPLNDLICRERLRHLSDAE